MRPPEGEVHEVDGAAGRHPAPGRLRRQRALEGDLVEEVGLHQLRFGDRTRDLQERFPGEDHPALGDRPHLAGETESGEGVQGLVAETDRGQVLEVLRFGPERLQETQAVLQAGGDEEPVVSSAPATPSPSSSSSLEPVGSPGEGTKVPYGSGPSALIPQVTFARDNASWRCRVLVDV